jgi:hypothetical protein
MDESIATAVEDSLVGTGILPSRLPPCRRLTLHGANEQHQQDHHQNKA